MNSTHNKPPTETKISRVCSGLMDGKKFTRFNAENLLSDHCLPSTISEIQKRFGITVSRKLITVLGYQGKPTQCCEYWIEVDERERILSLNLN